MIVLGIDPSKTCGLALVDTAKVKILAGQCFKVSTADRKTRTELEQAESVTLQVQEFIADLSAPVDLAAIEVPASSNVLMSYKRNDGTRATRIVTSSSQWLLIGMLWVAVSQLHDVVEVPPSLAKAAVGLSSKGQKESVVRMVEALTGSDLRGPAYAREAVADAAAVALAADRTSEQILAAAKKRGNGSPGSLK